MTPGAPDIAGSAHSSDTESSLLQGFQRLELGGETMAESGFGTGVPTPAGSGGSNEFSAAQLQLMATMIAAALSDDRGRKESGTDPTRQVATGGEKLLKWPDWNGDVSTFPLFMARLETKIEADRAKLGNDKTICNGILGTLPEDKQQRVSHWFLSGGVDGQYNVEAFLEHIKDKFEDKEAKQTAGDLLNRMRMGTSQKFDDFLQDFEFKLAQCDGLGWADRDKIIRVNTCINPKLANALVPVDLSDNDYAKWVKAVRRVAGRLESRPDYKSDRHTETWYLKVASIPAPSSRNGSTSSPKGQKAQESQASPKTDADGDIQMSGVNAIMMSSMAALINSLNGKGGRGRERTPKEKPAGKDKPRAKWISQEEMGQLTEEKKCFRCKKTGHVSRNCPDFRPAKPPGKRVNATRTKEVNDSEDSSESCESSSESDSGKE